MPRVDFRRLSVLFQILLLLSSICLVILVFCGLNPSFLQALSGIIVSLSDTAFNLFGTLRRQ